MVLVYILITLFVIVSSFELNDDNITSSASIGYIGKYYKYVIYYNDVHFDKCI